MCNAIDIPGHQDYKKNTFKGIFLGDVGILVISAIPGEFETSIAIDGMIRKHPLFAYTVGMKKLIVCVNKMDSVNVKYSSSRFEEIKK